MEGIQQAWRRCSFSLASALIALLAGSAGAQTQFSIKKIGPLPGEFGSRADAVNQKGQIAGHSIGAAAESPYFWDDGAITALPVPVTGSNFAFGIDATGSVVGESVFAGTPTHAALWRRTDAGIWTIEDLGTLPSYVFSRAYDLTDGARTIAGYVDDATDFLQAVVWEPVDATDPPWAITALGWLPGDVGSYAQAINEARLVVGASYTFGAAHPAYWTESGGVWSITALPTLAGGGGRGLANDVNEVGVIAGWAYGSNGLRHAVRWQSGAIVDLGTLGNEHSDVLAVNRAGRVVGETWALGLIRAFVSAGGGLVDLNALIPPGTGWNLKSAADISDRDQIVGWGDLGGVVHSFLLTPVSLKLSGPTPGVAGAPNTFAFSALAGAGTLYASFSGGESPLGTCVDVPLNLGAPQVLASIPPGTSSITLTLPAAYSGQTVYFQLAERAACRVSNVVAFAFP